MCRPKRRLSECRRGNGREMASPGEVRPRRLVILPIFNEEAMLEKVLTDLLPRVDLAIAVNDASTDRTREILEEWRRRTGKLIIVNCRRNAGASTALRKGYLLVAYLLEQGKISPDDLVVEMDADGQHDPRYLTILCDHYQTRANEVDVVLGRRDFRVYPKYKIFGNWLLTSAASVLGGMRYRDVESNFRVMPAKHFADLLRWYGGYRYSGAFEVGIILGRLGFRTDNSVLIDVPLYRHGAGWLDGFHVLWMGLRAWGRMIFRRPVSDNEKLLEETIAETSFPEENNVL
ncbi:MAG: glycosyltransferase family 2 protein [Candidatus Hydrogenedentota bacterium]|nr:MAG: glycosyltransferase family 2 protein [Candidatus Hydrogenedentota bacterium]